MKFITNLSRILVGILFIFSGYIKLNDPTGFSYKLDEYFSIFAGDLETEQDSLVITYAGPYSSEERDPVYHKIQMFRGMNQHQLSLSSSVDPEIHYNKNEEGVITDSFVNFDVNLFVDGRELESHVYKYEFQRFWDKQINVYVSATVNGKTLFEKGQDISAELIKDSTLTEQRYSLSQDIDVEEYLKADSIWVGFFLWLKQYALGLAIALCVIEILLGLALLVGWQSRFTSIMLLLTILAFTFLTWYSWTYNKVTDCGCFGDCIPLEPKESFYKDVILTILIVIIVLGAKYIKPIFSNPFSVKLLTIFGVLATGYSLYCYAYLPVIDCLHWKNDANICELRKVPEGELATDHKIITYHYLNGEGKPVDVIYDTKTMAFSESFGKDWKYQGQDEEVLEKAYEPPIHDFLLMNADGTSDVAEQFLAEDDVLLAVFVDVKKANVKSLKRLNEIANKWTEDGHGFYAVTASTPEEAEAFRHEHQLNFDFYYGDNTNLKSIIRSNPGLLLFKDSCVVKDQWPSRSLPKYEKLRKKVE